MRKTMLLILCGVISLATVSFVRAAEPTTKPAEPTVSDVRYVTLKGYTYAYQSVETTIPEIPSHVDVVRPKIDAAIADGTLKSVTSIFTYHDATPDGPPFTMDIGVSLREGSKVPADFKTIKVPDASYATVIYCGPLSEIMSAYQKIFTEVMGNNMKLTGITREAYLYFEGPESMSNVIQIQVEYTPEVENK